ncbi:spore protease YyaC [Paenibacillus naphthalenovorans]|uniref:spore protease YyaC n=1 Tax=Paenibacillus naphthalenovorans TaxID=162209 RepID=UPI003D2A440F
MVAHENIYKGVKLGGARNPHDLSVAMAAVIPSELTADDVIFLCIGTDRSTGDSLGPLVGTYLTGLGYRNVVGTLDDPTHAMNLAERIAALPEGKTVIAIDACLGQLSSVGAMNVYKGAIKPGAGVNKELPAAGDYGITAVVNVGGFAEYFVLQSTRLSVVVQLAKDITSAIVNIFPLEGARKVEPPKKKRGRPRKQKTEVVAGEQRN